MEEELTIKNFNKIKFIFLIGENRSGKDTIASTLSNFYKERKFNTQIISLADKLKQIYFYKLEKDGSPLLKSYFADQNIECDNLIDHESLKSISKRKELYELSLNIKKVEGVTFFCRELLKKIHEKTNVVIVPDMRFLDEYYFFKNSLKNICIYKIINTTKKVSFNEGNDFFTKYETDSIPYQDILYNTFPSFETEEEKIYSI